MKKRFNSDTISHEEYKYNTAGRLVEYTKSNISGFGSSFNQSLLPHESFTADKWTWGYKYNHAGVREQKRMLTSPHGDDWYDDEGIKVFAHLWEYYMTGAFGEEIVQYKGFQTSADVGMGPERKVYLGAYRYRAGGELLYHHDGTKEVNFTDNNGSVRLTVHNGGGIHQYDYKPFGDTLWTSAGTMNRDNFDGSIYDAESDLQMLGFRMYDNETGRFTTPDLLWSAFPAQTPYHYAYNSPLTYRDPTGLAPEKEKEREELQVFLIPDLDLHDGLINELKNNPAYNHYYIIAMADLTFANVMKLNDFYLSYGGGSGGRTAKGKGAENGQGGQGSDNNTKSNEQVGKKSEDKGDSELGWFGKLLVLFGLKEDEAKYSENNKKGAFVASRNMKITGSSVDQARKENLFGTSSENEKQQEDEYDAYRHLMWSALNCWILGEKEARKIGNAHENFPDNNPTSKQMDLHNNEIGFRIGNQLRNMGISNYMDAIRTAQILSQFMIRSGTVIINHPIGK
ncbi:MAG: hypothetical protein KF896_03375 [Ignavibacteriae bacterium]|nr:hypothetical protein [Ignavibacteriota bacterium]